MKTPLTGAVQRNHAIVNDGEPVHVPVSTVHVDPTVAPPDTVGATVFAGMAGAITASVFAAPASAYP